MCPFHPIIRVPTELTELSAELSKLIAEVSESLQNGGLETVFRMFPTIIYSPKSG